jgi:hypothetical protein
MPVTAATGSVTFNGAVADVRNVVVESEVDEKRYASSSTSGVYKRLAGHGDLRGTFSIYVPSGGITTFAAGDIDNLTILSETGTTLVSAVSCIILGISYDEVSIEGADIVGATVTWGRA